MQILFIDDQTKRMQNLNLDIIIICDTEGLRAIELKMATVNAEGSKHDNRMGTFVLSISDMTLINCMGF